MCVKRLEEEEEEGWASFHAAGTGKIHEINLAHVYLLQQRHLHPLQTVRGKGGKRRKKRGRKSGRNNLEETFPGLLRISFLFPHSLPPFRCFLRNHCLYPPSPPCSHTPFYIIPRYDKNRQLFPGQIYHIVPSILPI